MCTEPVSSSTALELTKAVPRPMMVLAEPGPMEGGERRQRAAGGAEVAIGQVDGRLLVHDDDALQLVLDIEEGVGEAPGAVAGHVAA